MNSFAPAKRTNRPLKIGLVGESGSGKTYSALLVARGLVGSSGKIALIDTENGRSLTYGEGSDGSKPLTPFDALLLDAPFTVQKYINAIDAAIKAGYDCLIIDSVTHEWDGPGGLNEQYSKTKQRGLIDWGPLTAKHKDFIDAVINSPINMICTLRAKPLNKQVKNEKTGEQEIVFEGLIPNTKPNPPIMYEFDIEAHMTRDHRAELRKGQYILNIGQPRALKVEDGKALREWQGNAPPARGAIYRDPKVAEGLRILGHPPQKQKDLIRAKIGEMDPDAPETLDKLLAWIHTEVNKLEEAK